VVFVRHDLAREDALQAIGAELAAAQKRVAVLGHDVELRKNKDGTEAKLFVRSADAEVKVEVNFVFRGTVMAPTRRSLTPAAQQMFSARHPGSRAG
ncbi:nucleotidyl transferase AbiEii/AbiGii toxin family protein, partial [Roseateles sp. GG27B]